MSASLFIVAAPSGAGKTTLVHALLAQQPDLRLSVSFTTRSPRSGEVDGVAYHFVDRGIFQEMQARGEFLESAEVHGNFYGTSRTWIMQQLQSGQDVLLEIDWQGAAQVLKFFPEAVSIFILPPSLAELERRLRGRGTDSEEVVIRRLAAARSEIAHARDFQYAIINNNLEEALKELSSIVVSARCRSSILFARERQFYADLINE